MPVHINLSVYIRKARNVDLSKYSVPGRHISQKPYPVDTILRQIYAVSPEREIYTDLQTWYQD
jgi:hypothetical protein